MGFMRAGIDCVAVTDHNSGEWIDDLRSALSELEQTHHPDYRPLVLFAGAEITANGGVHVLALLDTNGTSADIATLLGAVEYHGDRGSSEVAADLAPIGVVEAISKAGGIPILAHADGQSGAWKLAGNTLAPLLDFAGLFAMEIVDSNATKPELYQRRKLSWAEVIGSDSHSPNGNAVARFPGSHFTWVKMAKPTLEGLRLALLDGGGFSIHRSDEPEALYPFALSKHIIESIEIDRARFMGRGDPARLEFSPWLNALIGGRGTGKSTVVHALRLATGRHRELEHLEERSTPRLTFEGFNRVPMNRSDRGGLTDSTEIRCTIVRDGVRHRVSWSYRGLSVEEDAGGDDWRRSPAQSVTPARFPIRIFSQGQIAELAGDNPQALLHVIDEAAGVALLLRDLEEAEKAFRSSRARIRQVDARLAARDDLIIEVRDVERKLQRFEEAGHTEILRNHRQGGHQQREVDRQLEAAEAAARSLEQAASAVQPEDIPDGLFDNSSEEDLSATAILTSLQKTVLAEAQNVRRSGSQIRAAIESARSELSQTTWRQNVDWASAAYDTLVTTLQAEGVDDPREYGHLTQERQRLRSEQANLASLQEERERLVVQAQSRLQTVLEARRAVSAARQSFLEGALTENKYVRIRSRSYGDDPRLVERSLRESLGDDEHFTNDILIMEEDRAVRGIVKDLLDHLPEDPVKRNTEIEKRIDCLKQRIATACSGRGDFGGHFNNYLLREFERTPELLDKLMTWFPEDGLKVEYSVRGDGTDFRPITQASAGQRAAAMLAFLLAQGEEPLVLDQPEDDLDNHLIYDLVVRQMKENKLRRQIIVVTHNPNVVVNGDAEMVHTLDFRGGRCVVEQSGCLQEQPIREEVCRVMEGGHEAFERRYRRLSTVPWNA